MLWTAGRQGAMFLLVRRTQPPAEKERAMKKNTEIVNVVTFKSGNVEHCCGEHMDAAGDCPDVASISEDMVMGECDWCAAELDAEWMLASQNNYA